MQQMKERSELIIEYLAGNISSKSIERLVQLQSLLLLLLLSTTIIKF